MENERKKKFQDYAPPEQKPSGGYNLNGVYYSRDGQRLDDQPKKSWSQREYERAEREKIHCRAKREQGESEVDAQGNPVKDNSGVKKAIAIVVIVLGVVAIFGIVGMYLKSDNRTVGLIREAIQRFGTMTVPIPLKIPTKMLRQIQKVRRRMENLRI